MSADLKALRALHARLPAMSRLPFDYVLTQPVLIGMLRIALAAQRKAKAERQPGEFQLTP